MNIEYEKLVASLVLGMNDERMQSAEAVVRLATQVPLKTLATHPQAYEAFIEADRLATPRMIARTGSIFVLSEQDGTALNSLVLGADVASIELPPCPFARMWFEVWNETEAAPMPFRTFVDWTGDVIAPCALGIIEMKTGLEWLVYCVAGVKERLDDEGPPVGTDFFTWRIVGFGHEDFPKDAPEGIRLAAKLEPEFGDAVNASSAEVQENVTDLLSLPVWLMQFVTVQGAVYRDVVSPREQRRRFARNYSDEMPKVYFVDLRATGDAVEGNGSREYFHRWLVRGHYRLHPYGQFDLPRGRCTWVRPYVKGPPGAPWKGRPIHYSSEQED